MVAAWPSAPFPQIPLASGFMELEPKLTIRSQMDQGPAKVRRRTTAGVGPETCTFRFTPAQLATFRAFWRTTLQGGALPYTWIHPITGTAITCRIVDEPTYTPLERGIRWQASMKVEILP